MQTRARSTSNTLWDDVRELLEVWDEKNTALRADVQARLDRLKREGQSAWRRRVTGDANKRIRDHVRQTVDEAGERCVCLSLIVLKSHEPSRTSTRLSVCVPLFLLSVELFLFYVS